MKHPFRWLDRSGAISLPYFTLVLSQGEFDQALTHLKLRAGEFGDWCNRDACTWHLMSPEGKRVCIVCIKVRNAEGIERHPCQVASLLVHEAVHIWQEFCEAVGENRPSAEFEAYCVQHISQELFFEYDRRRNIDRG